MKPLVITAVILSLLGFIICAGSLWMTFFGLYQLDSLMDPKDGPIYPNQMASIKGVLSAFVETVGWFGVSVGALTIAWIACAFEFGKRYKRALAQSKVS
jgi:hypothetical protein